MNVGPRATSTNGVHLVNAMIIIVCLFFNIYWLMEPIRRFHAGAYDHRLYYLSEKDFDRMRELLPLNGKVGYYENRNDAAAQTGLRYVVSQFMMAPFVLSREERNCDYILGIFNSEESLLTFMHERGLEPLYNAGNGLILFRKGAKH